MSFTENFTDYSLKEFERGVRLPEIKILEIDKQKINAPLDCSNKDYLKRLCWAKCLEKIANGIVTQSKDQCVERLKMEFEVFEKTGTIDYILLLLETFGWCDKNNIKRGPGRGSAASSFALFCLDLVTVNPLTHNLNFTRFLSEARVKPKIIDGILYADGKNIADFDGDISFIDRPRVLNHIDEVFKGKTSKILTIQYLTGKMALKDVLKAYLEYSETQAREISGNIEAIFGKVQSLKEALEESKNLQEFALSNPKAMEIAKKIEGLQIAVGMHASGILISHDDIKSLIPLELSREGDIVSGYSMNDALSIICKIDALGLRTCDILASLEKLTGIKCSQIDVNDSSIYEFLNSTSDYYGLFQISAGLTKDVTVRVKPQTIEHLIAIVAISRPGSLRFIDDFVAYVNQGITKNIYPQIDQILAANGNILLFQEDINRICQEVYKMSAVDADEVRRAIGKKKKEEIAKWEPILFENGKKYNIPDEVTKWFWDTCNASADYLFNKAHSASYSYLTAYTAWYKANYPLEFFMACLQMHREEPEPQACLAEIEKEMKNFGYKILPPDLVNSDLDFKIEENGVRFGLNSVRGISDKMAEAIKLFKESEVNNKFSLFLELKKCGLNIGVVSSLIQAGCMDGYASYKNKDGNNYISRSRLVYEACTFNLLTDKEKTLCFNVGGSPEVNWDVILALKYLSTQVNEKGKPVLGKRLDTIRKKHEPYAEIFKQNSKNERLANYFYERKVLGYSYSESLTNLFGDKIDNLTVISNLENLKEGLPCRVIGFVSEPAKGKTSKGNDEFKFILKDETGEIRVKSFNDKIGMIEYQNGRLPEEDDIVICNLKKMSGGTYFVERGLDGSYVGICTAKIYMKLSELKDDKKKKNEENEGKEEAEKA